MAKRSKPPLPNIALLVETSRSYGRHVLRGIGDYARIHGAWVFHLPITMPVNAMPSRDEWDGDGIIAQPHQNQDFVRQLASCGKPVVSLSGPPGQGRLHSVRRPTAGRAPASSDR
jgi:LacI family transcriptional regulator